MYLTLPNYTNNFLHRGFSEADFHNGGSDSLIDAIIAWGNLEQIRSRVRAHHSAGADHVCVQVLTKDSLTLPLKPLEKAAIAW